MDNVLFVKEEERVRTEKKLMRFNDLRLPSKSNVRRTTHVPG